MSAAPLLPADEAALAECVKSAIADGPLMVEGAGSKAGLGRPVQAARTLSTRAMTGVTLYEPTELVFAALAGTPIAEVEATLAKEGQRLPFTPPDLGRLYRAEPDAGTLGGVISTNLSGSNRIARGAARDSVIGLRAVNGRGEAISSGGRVMKNVTGYDLAKLLTGAHGTLGILSEITLKVLPAPETEATLRLAGLNAETAAQAMAAALGSPFDLSAAAWTQDGGCLLRVEGFADQVAYRAPALRDQLSRFGAAELVEGDASAALWAALRVFAPLDGKDDAIIWRISCAPMAGPLMLKAGIALGGEGWMDWGGGQVWIALPPGGGGTDGGAKALRQSLAEAGGGHATLMRAPAPMRSVVPPFEPQAAPLAALSARVKLAFDPHRVLNPGRMAADL